MRRFIFGFVIGAIVIVAIPLVVITTGVINMGASAGSGKIEKRVATWAVDRSLSGRVPKMENPHASAPDGIDVGLAAYRDSCVQCHGAPGIDAAAFAMGLNPPAPDLTKVAEDRTDGELFWIAKHGIRMTGMPAIGNEADDEQIWKVVTFIRHLPNLTEDEQKELVEPTAKLATRVSTSSEEARSEER